MCGVFESEKRRYLLQKFCKRRILLLQYFVKSRGLMFLQIQLKIELNTFLKGIETVLGHYFSYELIRTVW